MVVSPLAPAEHRGCMFVLLLLLHKKALCPQLQPQPEPGCSSWGVGIRVEECAIGSASGGGGAHSFDFLTTL